MYPIRIGELQLPVASWSASPVEILKVQLVSSKNLEPSVYKLSPIARAQKRSCKLVFMCIVCLFIVAVRFTVNIALSAVQCTLTAGLWLLLLAATIGTKHVLCCIMTTGHCKEHTAPLQHNSWYRFCCCARANSQEEELRSGHCVLHSEV